MVIKLHPTAAAHPFMTQLRQQNPPAWQSVKSWLVHRAPDFMAYQNPMKKQVIWLISNKERQVFLKHSVFQHGNCLLSSLAAASILSSTSKTRFRSLGSWTKAQGVPTTRTGMTWYVFHEGWCVGNLNEGGGGEKFPNLDFASELLWNVRLPGKRKSIIGCLPFIMWRNATGFLWFLQAYPKIITSCRLIDYGGDICCTVCSFNVSSYPELG